METPNQIPHAAINPAAFHETDNPNQLSVEFLGTAISLNPFYGNVSASRGYMMAGQLSQTLVIEGATPRKIFTGTEREYGKYTFNIKMPEDGEILRIIDKYPQVRGVDSFKLNSESVVLYESVKTREIGMFTIKRFHSTHQSFGFQFHNTKNIDKISPGRPIYKDTIFCNSSNVLPNGDYQFGIETNVVFMSIPQIIEDGVVISRSLAAKMVSHGIERRMLEFGERYFPINLYGNDTTYKIHPDIGEYVRDDGLISVLREFDPLLAVVTMTVQALQQPDLTYDKPTFTEPGAQIVDVNVFHDNTKSNPPTPAGMEEQPARYLRAKNIFFEKIRDVERTQRKRKREGLRLTPEFHQLVKDALADDPQTVPQRVTQVHRRVPLDDWRIELTVDYKIKPNVGSKLTDLFGGFLTKPS